MKIVIVAGGTGGHIYPGIALAEELRERKPPVQILFLGSEAGPEKDLVRRAGFAIKLIKARPLIRKISFRSISAPLAAVLGFFQALKILREFSPQLLISTGGYVSLAAVLAASRAASRSFSSPVRRYRLTSGGASHRWATPRASFRANARKTSVAS